MNTIGTIFRVSIFGESHGPFVGVIIDGCPAGLQYWKEELMADLSRRKGLLPGTTARRESDEPEVISGIINDHTTGAPLVLCTRNRDFRPGDYEQFTSIPRPGHADFTAGFKYKGFSDMRGGGHFSGRLTWGIVAAGYFARQILSPAIISASLVEAGGETDTAAAIARAMETNDTVGGVVECVVKNVPKGLGEPAFMSVEAALGMIAFGIPAVNGVEFGAGFASSRSYGSVHNDPFVDARGKTSTNNAGGINGGITNGNDLVMRVSVKPAASTGVPQKTFDTATGEMTELEITGRHDTCIARRIPVILESAVAIGLADLLMTDRGINGIRER
ncbi:MAG: chorismate synthase [Bacteroidales bacterium]|jgi:chorismate synthase|nr:chorismate synthase [Bacteroidales bacterium]NLD63716.1 chorismate synthase [Bacteroidales bacterium]HNT94040.1 chorismate synthase [Bacteroidales bacterium]HPJ04201.1 chorismate synthase [Bacteroidales bacterium]HPQ63994.1 chorismate synthase [Bacteroidales bacterium]